MSIPNIESNKIDRFYFGGNDTEGKQMTLDEGTYEIGDLESAINTIAKDSSGEHDNFKIELKPDNVTMRTRLYCTEPVDFRMPNNFGPLLGFTEKVVLEKNKWHTSPSTANIFPVSPVRVVYNIAHGSYSNGIERHTIYDFFPTVGAGFKIVEKPKNIIYLPVKDRQLSTIEIRLEDQNGDLENFREETISFSLHLRKSIWD